MIPEHKELLKKMANKPFTLLGINSDRMSRSALKEKLDAEKIAWPQVCEGPDNKISGLWNVQAFPTLYVIDQQGVIRARGMHSEEQVGGIVEKLLATTETQPTHKPG